MTTQQYIADIDLTQIPEAILDLLERLIARNKEWNRRVTSARQSDLTFNGGGRYVYESCAAQEPHGESTYFYTFRKLASQQGIDGDAVLNKLGYEPELRLTDIEKNWATLPY